MRVLFAVLPGAGHLFPTIPLAWALRAAGHDVLVATAADEVDLAVSAGLPAVNTAPDLDVRATFGQGLNSGSDLARMLRHHGQELARNEGRDPDFVLWMFAGLSGVMAGETVRVARIWKPDLVVYTRLQGAGLLAAADLGVPAIEHGFDVVRQDGFAARYLPFLAETAEELGVPQRLPEIGVVHVTPPPLLVGEGVDNWYALAQSPVEPNSVSHRGAAAVLRVVTAPKGPELDAAHETAHAVMSAVAPWTLGRTPNFLQGNLRAAEHAQECFEPTVLTRLAALKAVHDPRNIFCCNVNVPSMPNSQNRATL